MMHTTTQFNKEWRQVCPCLFQTAKALHKQIKALKRGPWRSAGARAPATSKLDVPAGALTCMGPTSPLCVLCTVNAREAKKGFARHKIRRLSGQVMRFNTVCA